MSTSNTNKLVHEAINDDYEWIQYNQHLRLIRSVKDDMYQMQSILNACYSNKLAKDWFNNQSTKELLSEIDNDRKRLEMAKNSQNNRLGENSWSAKLVENRKNIGNGLRGYYVHRLLVNHVAMWASPRYSWYIMKLLDDLYSKERQQLEQKVVEMKPRQVPKKKEKDYKYMIWKEELQDPEDKDMIILHLVRRNKRVFSAVQKIANDPNKCWFYRENLPIAMTPNEDVKDIIRKTLPDSEFDMKAFDVMTYKKHLPLLLEKITEYFDHFQE